MLIEDVGDAVGDLVEIMKTYKSKGKLSQIVTSTLFKRRQDEAEAVVDAAVSRLQVSFSVYPRRTLIIDYVDVGDRKKYACIQKADNVPG